MAGMPSPDMPVGKPWPVTRSVYQDLPDLVCLVYREDVAEWMGYAGLSACTICGQPIEDHQPKPDPFRADSEEDDV